MLQGVGACLIFLPLLGITALARLVPAAADTAGNAFLVAALGMFLLSLLMLWGNACVLLVGKRLLASNAGRTRTSFKAVRTQARGFVLPLLLTDILRTGMTVLWALPAILLVIAAMATGYAAGLEDAYKVMGVAGILLIPSLIYSIRTTFAGVVVVTEGTMYRPALRRSLELTRGRVWTVLLVLIGISLTLFLPLQALSVAASMAAGTAPAPAADVLDVTADAVISAFQAVSITLYTLSTILLFKELSASHPSND